MLGTLRSWIAAKFRAREGRAPEDPPRYQARHERRAEAARRRLRGRAHARMVLLCGEDYTHADVHRMHRRGAITTAQIAALVSGYAPSRRAA